MSDCRKLVCLRGRLEPVLVGVIVLGFLCVFGAARPLLAQESAVASQNRTDGSLLFVENVGQFDPEARFQLLGGSTTLWLTADALWFSVLEEQTVELAGVGFDDALNPFSAARRGASLRLTFDGAAAAPRMEPFGRLDTHVSYFIGDDPAQWRTNVPVWSGVRYIDLYPGVDLEITGEGGRLAPRFVMHGDPTQAVAANLAEPIRLHVEGAAKLSIADNQLLIGAEVRDVALPLFAVVNDAGEPLQLAQAPAIAGMDLVAPFAQPAATPGQAIQAAGTEDLVYSTFLGGGDKERVFDIAVAGGTAYVAGLTDSLNFPDSPGAYDPTFAGGDDAFVLALTPDGSAVFYATFLGGIGADIAYAIDVDPAGNAYVTGPTTSAGFPTTDQAFDRVHNDGGGVEDVFIAKLNSSGDDLVYSTLLGGKGIDWSYELAIDDAGNAFVAGYTASSDFPVVNAVDATFNGARDAFVAKLHAGGSQLDYATYLGGGSTDVAFGLDVDGVGNAFLSGRTNSTNFPATFGAYDTVYGGGGEPAGFFQGDAFVAKLGPVGNSLLYATYLGGSGHEGNFAKIVVLPNGDVAVTGVTGSTNFPVITGALDNALGGTADVYVTRLNAAGSDLVFSTYLGGDGREQGNGIGVDAAGGVYVAGWTDSSNFPTSPDGFDGSHNGDLDAFVAKLSPDGKVLDYGAFLGGTLHDIASTMVVDGDGQTYVSGWTASVDFPTTFGAYDTSHHGNGEEDGFVAKMTFAAPITGSYSIHGWVKTADDLPVAGATVVTVGGAYSTTTGADGGYALTGLPAGVYTVQASKAGAVLSPHRATVQLSASTPAQSRHFVATTGAGQPDPFMELPLAVGSSMEFLAALQDFSENGRVGAWFDHTFPDRQLDRQLSLWDGWARTVNPGQPRAGCFGFRCFDGHHALHFPYIDPDPATAAAENVDVLAVAAGKVVEVKNNCVLGDATCGSGDGNYALVLHPTAVVSYFVRYTRLQSVTVAANAVVVAGQPLGVMGGTGETGGRYLGLAVYFDNGNGVWDGVGADLPVDPFGWQGEFPDPAVAAGIGAPGGWLWSQSPVGEAGFAGSAGAVFSDTVGNIRVSVPAGAVDGQITLELVPGWRGPDAADGRRSLGRAFRLQPLAWTDPPIQSALSMTDIHPISLTVYYTGVNLSHVVTGQIALHRWDDATRSWRQLSGTNDPVAQTNTTTTTHLGYFDLQAPLLCPDDATEPDDHFYAAPEVMAKLPPGNPLQRIFDGPEDEDWLQVRASKGIFHTVETSDLADGVTTGIRVYGLDGVTELANAAGSPAARLEWLAPEDGVYFIRIERTAGAVSACSATYNVTVTQAGHALYLPYVAR